MHFDEQDDTEMNGNGHHRPETVVRERALDDGGPVSTEPQRPKPLAKVLHDVYSALNEQRRMTIELSGSVVAVEKSINDLKKRTAPRFFYHVFAICVVLATLGVVGGGWALIDMAREQRARSAEER